MSKLLKPLLEIGQECWVFFGGDGYPKLTKAVVDQRNDHHYRKDGEVARYTQYKVTYKCGHDTRTTHDWMSSVFATKEEAIASLGGGE